MLRVFCLHEVLEVTDAGLLLDNACRLSNLAHVKSRFTRIDTRGGKLGICRHNSPIQNNTAVPNDNPRTDDAVLSYLYIRPNFHGLDDRPFINEHMATYFHRHMSDLVVLLLEWRFNYHPLIQNYISADENLCQICAQYYLLLQYCMIIYLNIIRALYQATLAD